MSLGKCPECGHIMSSTAKFCVYRGGTAPAVLPKQEIELRLIKREEKLKNSPNAEEEE